MNESSSQDRIPTGKVERAVKFIQTGAKLGGNYVKHYSKKLVNPSLSKDELHTENAKDVYEVLSTLKGSALKVAQMLSMDKGMLPKAYSQKFTMAQYQAPPLSGPLVEKTFTRYFGKNPRELFDTFDLKSVNAASIGQVHAATKNGKKLAVKIQYPGVAESIQSDLKLVKPVAFRLLNLSEKELDKYIKEVEAKLLEETDYELELKRSVEISAKCAAIQNLRFPAYYPEYSCKKILTMDWLEGLHLDQFLKTNPSQEIRNQIGQALWDFYDFQVHTLKQVHADPHPGNFLMFEDGTLGIIDFGCVKEIPMNFYYHNFALLLPEIRNDEKTLQVVMKGLDIIYPSDEAAEVEVIKDAFYNFSTLLSEPFAYPSFDFGNHAYIEAIYAMGDEIGKLKELRNSREGRGSSHALYINRTYFGLYALLNQLEAVIENTKGAWEQDILNHFGYTDKSVRLENVPEMSA
jgi:predicted unusual protein kinase regulating ubiquinone biosynthesis (AarF/ABC1/UbiB family)